jgi:hypothetical protein
VAKIDSVHEEAQPLEGQVEAEHAAAEEPAEVEEMPAKEEQPVVDQSLQAE